MTTQKGCCPVTEVSWKQKQRSKVCACASNGATKRRSEYFHDIVLFVGHPHPINDIFLVIYIFVYVLACTTRTNRNRSYELFYLLLVAGLSFPRYVFSVLLEFFVRLNFAFSAPVCPRFVVWKRFSHLVKDLVH